MSVLYQFEYEHTISNHKYSFRYIFHNGLGDNSFKFAILSEENINQ